MVARWSCESLVPSFAWLETKDKGVGAQPPGSCSPGKQRLLLRYHPLKMLDRAVGTTRESRIQLLPLGGSGEVSAAFVQRNPALIFRNGPVL